MFKWIKDKWDSDKIDEFMLHSAYWENYEYRSTWAIASDCNLTDKRVRELMQARGCKQHPRNKDLWRVLN